VSSDDPVERSRAEDGTVDYRAAADREVPTVVRSFGQCEDAAAFEPHTQSDHVAFGEALPGLLAGMPDLRRFEVESVTELGS
jgi:quinol monooxygenase YgiN